jgi:alpha-L-fucosidase
MIFHFGLETFTPSEQLPPTTPQSSFAPTALDVDQWCASARMMKATYAVLTAKHHVGFCLWPSTTQPVYNSVTAGSVDVVAAFVAAARRKRLRVGLYFSIWDRKFEANTPGFTSAQYITHLKAQLTELLTNYGRVDLIWTDGWGWNPTGTTGYANIPYATINNHIKSIQPLCLLVENNHEGTLAHSEIVEYEYNAGIQGLPAGGTTPSEAILTARADQLWFGGYGDTSYQAASAIVTADTTMSNANGTILVNCPPDQTGKLPAGLLTALASYGAALP